MEKEKEKEKINILLVDDVPANLLSLEAILHAPDRNLVRASSGEEALRYLLDEDAAVILLDVHMPTIDGLETAALIRGRERTRNLPIIFLTAHDSAGAQHISDGYSLGAVDYIVKPIDPEALKSKVAVFVELYRKTEKIKQQAELLREQNIELENANLQRLSRLIDLGQRLAAERDPEQVLEKFCAAAREIVGAGYATVGLLDEDGVTLRQFFTSGLDRAQAIGAGIPQISQRFLNQRFKNQRSIRYAGSNGIQFLPEQSPVRSFVGAPIIHQGQTRGWLYLADKLDAPEFSAADERFTVTLTQAIVFYENARLYGDLQSHAAALEQEIADRKLAEKQRAEMLTRAQAAQAEAEEANRLKDEFLATVSHELRAPLNAMLGWVTLAREGDLDRDGIERAMETIERNARVQKKLVDDLLDVSAIITGNLCLDLKPTNLASVIDLAVESVRPAAEAKDVRLGMEMESRSNWYETEKYPVDPNRIQQVIWNLVYNAVKFTPAGGSVTIRLNYLPGRAEIEVMDTGIGIAPEFLPYVFDRFRQADGGITRKHGGLGLGLAIVRHLIEMHGGTVSAESAGEGLGATFKIKLPLAIPEKLYEKPGPSAVTIDEINLPNSAPNLSGLRALVVDDQADARDLLAAILSMKDAEVRTAGSVTEALNILSAWQPEIMISDIAMPEGGGYELIQRVRSVGNKIPAIALTAHASAEERIQALTAGFQLHLSKPVEPYELVMSVASLIGRFSHLLTA